VEAPVRPDLVKILHGDSKGYRKGGRRNQSATDVVLRAGFR
jgi:hypothetical protein